MSAIYRRSWRITNELISIQKQSNQAEIQEIYVDPAINALFNSLTRELDEKNRIIDRQREELAAVKFSPNSSVGLRLVEKCSSLKAENEELGHLLQQGLVEKYKLEIALQSKLITELNKALNGRALSELELNENVILTQIYDGARRIRGIRCFFGQGN